MFLQVGIPQDHLVMVEDQGIRNISNVVDLSQDSQAVRASMRQSLDRMATIWGYTAQQVQYKEVTKVCVQACLLCYAVYCVDGEVRLVEGETDWEGRVEMCVNGRWGTIGDSEWTLANSHVVCNSLGYDITGKWKD